MALPGPLLALVLAAASPTTTDLDLPPGPAATAWQAVTPTTAPAAPAPPWPAWTNHGPEGWGAAAPWQRWADLVRAEASGPSDPARRAALARFARIRGRDFEAWDHFAACAGSPATLASLAPLFFPGVPAGHPVEAGGRPAPLPANVLLTPALPPRPPPLDGTPVGFVKHAMDQTGFTVGDTRIAMRLVLERDGVQVDLHHLEGPPVRVFVRLPVPPGEEIGISYVDWFRQEGVTVDLPLLAGLPLSLHVRPLLSAEAGVEIHFVDWWHPDGPLPPLSVIVSADEPRHELWGRFRAVPEPWPTRLPRELPAQLDIAGLVFLGLPGRPAFPFVEGLAEAVGRVLDVPAHVEAGPAPSPRGAVAPLVIHMPPYPSLWRKAAALISLVEAFVLDV